MKFAYVDSSVLVGMLFEEKNAPKWRRFLDEMDEVASSSLIEAELFSAAVREKIVLSLATNFLESVSLIHPDRPLREEYGKIFALGHVRGADAYHLACALFLDPTAKSLAFLTADIQQAEIAKRLGFDTPNP